MQYFILYYGSTESVLKENIFLLRRTTQAISFNSFILKDLLRQRSHIR